MIASRLTFHRVRVLLRTVVDRREEPPRPREARRTHHRGRFLVRHVEHTIGVGGGRVTGHWILVHLSVRPGGVEGGENVAADP